MTVRTVNNLPAAMHDATVRCWFAIELSKKDWVVGFNTALSDKISRRYAERLRLERVARFDRLGALGRCRRARAAGRSDILL